MTQNEQTPADGKARERLLHAAAELFAQKGYAATTVREIVAAAGVTKPVLYYYFQNKEGLYLELMQASCNHFLALIGGPESSQGSVVQRLGSLADRTFQVFKDNMEAMRAMYAAYYGPPQGAPVVDLDSVYLAFHHAVLNLVQEGQARGELRPGNPLELAWVLMANVHLAMEMEMCLPHLAPGREGLARIVDLVLEALRSPGPAGKE